MRDILPPESARWRQFVAAFAETVTAAGYGQIIPPLLEDIGVFHRVGEATDIVTKEMYDFVDKGDRHVALRPEQTASVCRAFVQHRPATPWKVWYSGPNFRYERPQRGRYRQFDQVGIEVLGANDPYLDVEVIALGWGFFQRLGLQQVHLHLNSLGEPQDRQNFVAALQTYFTANIDQLSDASKVTLAKNALRVLDSKRPEDFDIIAKAPKISDFYSEAARTHFETVLAGLRTLNIPFVVNEKLVRGLDYYRHTTFEFVGGTLDSAQNAIGGGGRYDGLVETTGGSEALVITHQLRDAGFSCDRSFENRSMKSQMKAADKSGALVAIIIGSDEVEANAFVLRPLRGEEQQSTIPRSDLIPSITKALS